MMQCLFLPAMAVAFATDPIVGQNYAAGKYSRVRETFGLAALIGSCIMVCVTIFCQWGSVLLVGAFTNDASAVAVGAEYLRVISWNFLANGLVFTCSGVFQGLGNTIPSVLSSASRVITFVVPTLWLASLPHFDLLQVWYVSIGSVTLQACFSLWLVRREFKLRLPPAAEPVAA
jgi:Na+-driven multidrug efflux pump